MNRLGQITVIFQIAVSIRTLYDNSGNRVVEHTDDRFAVGSPFSLWDDQYPECRAKSPGCKDLEGERMHGLRDEHDRTLSLVGEHDRGCLCSRSVAVVQRCVRHVESCELTDHRLKLEDRL